MGIYNCLGKCSTERFINLRDFLDPSFGTAGVFVLFLVFLPFSSPSSSHDESPPSPSHDALLWLRPQAASFERFSSPTEIRPSERSLALFRSMFLARFSSYEERALDVSMAQANMRSETWFAHPPALDSFFFTPPHLRFYTIDYGTLILRFGWCSNAYSHD